MDERLIRNPDAVLREEDAHGGLIFNPDTNQIRVLNPTGLTVWELCDGSRTRAQIATELAARFDAPAEADVAADVGVFLDALERDGFVGIVEPDRGP